MTHTTISHGLKTIFIHIPKTAGSSMSHMIMEYKIKAGIESKCNLYMINMGIGFIILHYEL